MAPQALNIGDSIQTGFSRFFGFLPNILGFIVILIIGYVVATLVKKLVNKAAAHFKLDQSLTSSQAGSFVEKVSPGGRPSNIVGGVAFWVIFLFALTAAIGALKIPAVTAFMNQVLSYLPNVIVAVLIFVIAAALAGAVVAAVQRTMGDTPTGKLVAAVLPGLIMAIAVFMILTQLKIASTIVTITYVALIGMLALTAALAFGIGGVQVASDMWRSAYQRSRQNSQQVKSDAQTGKRQAKEQTAQATEKVRSTAENDGMPAYDDSPQSGAHRG